MNEIRLENTTHTFVSTISHEKFNSQFLFPFVQLPVSRRVALCSSKVIMWHVHCTLEFTSEFCLGSLGCLGSLSPRG